MTSTAKIDEVEFYMTAYHAGRNSMLRTLLEIIKINGTLWVTKDEIETLIAANETNSSPMESHEVEAKDAV